MALCHILYNKEKGKDSSRLAAYILCAGWGKEPVGGMLASDNVMKGCSLTQRDKEE